MISTSDLSGAKMLRWSAALLLIGGLLLGAFAGSLGVVAQAFGAVLLGFGQIRASENRGERSIGSVPGGAFAGVWMLAGVRT